MFRMLAIKVKAHISYLPEKMFHVPKGLFRKTQFALYHDSVWVHDTQANTWPITRQLAPLTIDMT